VTKQDANQRQNCSRSRAALSDRGRKETVREVFGQLAGIAEYGRRIGPG
jgi:hypothetical protein